MRNTKRKMTMLLMMRRNLDQTLSKKIEPGKSEKEVEGLGIVKDEEEEDDGNDDDDDRDDEDFDEENDKYKVEDDYSVEERDEEYKEADEEELEVSSSRKKTKKQNIEKSGLLDLDGDKGEGAVKVKGGCRRINVIKVEDDEDIFEHGIISPPRNPSFVAKLREKSWNVLFVPAAVIKDHKLKLPQNLIMLDENGKKWSAEVKLGKDGRTCLTGGWRPFCKWNYLKWEDRCICEFMRGRDKKDIFLKMCIVRAGSWLPKGQNGVRIS